ncbi:RHS repeat-associated core domain-containing protein [Massilia sp. R2A-15]|uniref:RHS repeat-associated core domain-containing protein n=1 Tax=Massilia sp. R2A-15 TaxID=3064278 RepID=UPI0027351EEB|nr:RHS repeat-associated core domain-containing protein [Massilia sp. R2A-15]WLI89466.1 RHS repeat-associated core domain-containing protein [Massilia sp. R2A-15]
MSNDILGSKANPGLSDGGTHAPTLHRPAGGLCTTSPTETELHHHAQEVAKRLHHALDRVQMAASWADTNGAVVALLGEKSFTAGALVGIGENIAGSVYDLGRLAMVLAMADVYESRHAEHFWQRFIKTAVITFATRGINVLASVAFPVEFERRTRTAFEQREMLSSTVKYAFEHPGEVFSNLGDEAKKSYQQFKDYRARHTLAGEFHAGVLFGALLLDVLMVLDGAAAVAKLAGKIPGLLEVLKGLRRTVRPVAEAGGKAGAEAAGRAAAEASEARRPGSARGGGGKGREPGPNGEPEKAPEGKARKDCACALAGKPVDAINGCKLLIGEIDRDFSLPAPLALVWQRSYSSDNPVVGLLGQGWSLPISLALEFSAGAITLLDAQHRGISFPLLRVGESFYSRHEQITLSRIDVFTFELIDKDSDINRFLLPDPSSTRARLVSKTDRNGNRIGIDYDARQLPSRVIDSAGRTLVLSVDARGRLTAVIDLREEGGQPVVLVHYEYNAAGDLVQVRNRAGEVTREFAYKNHIMVMHAQPGGLISEYEYNEYFPHGRVMRNFTNTGQSWRFVYAARQTLVTDNLGRKVYYRFDAERRYLGMTNAMGGKEVRELDAFGNLTALTDASGRTERFQYDHRSRVTRIEAADGAVTRIIYDLRFDKPVSVTDAMGGVTTLRYDGNANLTDVIDALGQRTQYRYDGRGLPVEVVDARGGSKRLAYNPGGQLTEHTDCSGQSTKFEHDADGNLARVRDALGNVTAYEYDLAGRLTEARYPDGGSEAFEYDALGRLTAHIDAAGHRTRYAFDAEGRLLERTNALGGQLAYHYDGAKRLAELVNENGAVYAFAYDALDRLTQETGFDTRTTRYRYDPAGLPLAKTELGEIGRPGNPIDTVYRRDAAGRLKEKVVTAGTEVLSTRFRYDLLGRLTEGANATATVELEYDAIGQLIAETSRAPACMTRLRHQYDVLGNRTQTILPDGRALNHLFYGSGHLHQINLDGEIVSDIERDAAHREILRTQGALTSRFDYDPVGRLTGQVTRLDRMRADAGLAGQRDAWQASDAAPFEQADGPELISRRYQYDRSGNLVGLDDQRFGRTNYRYDAIGRILAASQPNLEETFSFDPAHNLLDPAGANAGGRVVDNRVTVYEDKRYAYDTHGDLVEKKIGRHTRIALEWNAEHQLTRSHVTRNAHEDVQLVQHTEYGYDPFGRRILKHDAFGETHFAWDGNRLLSETRGSHERTYLYAGRSFVPLAQVDSSRDVPPLALEAEIFHFHVDHIGTPRELTDAAGNLIWTSCFKAWGNVLIADSRHCSSNPLAQSHAQQLRYQGQYFDPETGLHYNRFRYYDPDVGRFVAQDPIGLWGGTNIYQYGPNPSGWIDPLGLAGDPATATHITYVGIDSATGKPYVGYASMQGDQLGLEVLERRYSNDFSRFASPPDVIYRGYGQDGKDIARGLEQRTFERFGGQAGTANLQNPVGAGNARHDIYLDAADEHLAAQACVC